MMKDSTVAMKQPRPKQQELAWFCIVFALHVLLTFQGCSEYFLRWHQGFNGALRSAIARNYVRYGLSGTGGLPIKNWEKIDDPQKGRVHWHHPPLANLLIAGSFVLFGESEASARAVPMTASLITFLLLYWLVRRRYGPFAALASGLFFALIPMQVEYGKMPNYESIIVMFALAGMCFLDRIRYESGGILSYLGLATTLCLAGFTDWPGFIFAGMVGAEAIVRKPRKPWATAIIGISAGLLLWGTWQWLSSSPGGHGLTKLAEARSGGQAAKYSYGVLLTKLADRFQSHIGIMMSILAAMWCLYELIRRRRLDPVVGVLCATVTIYFAVFCQAAIIHNFYLYYITPAVAVAAGVGIVEFTTILFDVGKKTVAFISSRLEDKIRMRGFDEKTARILPPALSIAVIGVFGVFFFSQQLAILNQSRLISIDIWAPMEKMKESLPMAGRLDGVLLAKHLNSSSDPNQKILYYGRLDLDRIRSQFFYYLNRGMKKITNYRKLPGGGYLLISKRFAKTATQAELGKKYAVTVVLNHLIYDLNRPGPAATFLELQFLPATWGWSYKNSILYPPHRLRNDPDKAAEYLKSLGL